MPTRCMREGDAVPPPTTAPGAQLCWTNRYTNGTASTPGPERGRTETAPRPTPQSVERKVANKGCTGLRRHRAHGHLTSSRQGPLSKQGSARRTEAPSFATAPSGPHNTDAAPPHPRTWRPQRSARQRAARRDDALLICGHARCCICYIIGYENRARRFNARVSRQLQR